LPFGRLKTLALWKVYNLAFLFSHKGTGTPLPKGEEKKAIQKQKGQIICVSE